MNVKGVWVKSLSVSPATGERMSIDVDIENGSDFVSCASAGLLQEILDAIGEDEVIKHFSIPVME